RCRICREFSAQDQDRGRDCGRPGRQDRRRHHLGGQDRSDRRRQDLRHQPRPCGPHPDRRVRRSGPLGFRAQPLNTQEEMKMTFKRPSSGGLGALAVLGLCALGLADAAFAEDAAPAAAAAAAPVPNKGDVAWMLTSSALVLMMSIPGLALFYGGLVRTKNMASVLTQVFAIVSMIGVT